MIGTYLARRPWLLVMMSCGSFMAAGASAALSQVPGDPERDLLDQTRRLERVAAQKLENELGLALRQAERLAASDPGKAVARLKAELARLEEDTTLAADRRQALQRVFKDRIRVIESGAARLPALNEKQVQLAIRRAQEERKTAEQNQIKQGLKVITGLQKDGKTEQAGREAARLSSQNQNEPSAQAVQRAAARIDEIDRARKLARERERAAAGAFADIDRSATPSGVDVEFPKDWVEKTRNRSTAVKLTEKEKEILRALKTPITVTFKNSRLQTVLDYFATVSGQSIVLDEQALRDVEASYDTPITLSVKGVSLRFTLRKVLADIGMTYVIKEETIQATSAARAKEMMVVRGYYIGDLLAGMAALNGNVLPNPFAPFDPQTTARAQTQAAEIMKSVKELMEMIETSVDTHSWQHNGGAGSISFNAPTMSLIIKQSAEVHALLGNSGLIK
jgi:hypothetical protein